MSRTSKKISTTKKEEIPRGAIYVSNLPHGFYEDALNGFFSQFGVITKIKVARSQKNAAPMGWAYIGFENEEVAKIAAETMNGYYIFAKALKCSFINNSNLNPKMWRNSNLRPELCKGTIGRIRHQRKMQQNRARDDHMNKQKLKLEKSLKFLQNKFNIKPCDVAQDISDNISTKNKDSVNVKDKNSEIKFQDTLSSRKVETKKIKSSANLKSNMGKVKKVVSVKLKETIKPDEKKPKRNNKEKSKLKKSVSKTRSTKKSKILKTELSNSNSKKKFNKPDKY